MRLFIPVAFLLTIILFYTFSRAASSDENSALKSELRQNNKSSTRSDEPISRGTWKAGFADERLEGIDWSLADFDNYLAENDRGPTALALSFLITREPGLLAELKTHPNSRIALQLLASSHSLSSEERLLWAEKLHRNNPKNGLGYLLMARSYAELGDVSSFKEALKAAQESPEVISELGGMKKDLVGFARSIPTNKQASLLFREVNLINTRSADEISPAFLQGTLSEMSADNALEVVSSYLAIVESLRQNSSLAISTPHPSYNTPEGILKVKRDLLLGSLAVHSLELMEQVDESLLPEIQTRDGEESYLDYKE